MVEPTETETKESLDAFADALHERTGRRTRIPSSCEAPVTTPVRRLDEARAARHLKLRWYPAPALTSAARSPPSMSSHP